MSTKPLVDFLREQRARGTGAFVNWEEERAGWLTALVSLGGRIEAWLKPALGEGLVEFRPSGPVLIQEESLGAYQAPAWDIVAGGRHVSVLPVARLVIGATGRVDLVSGPRRRVLLRTESGDWVLVPLDLVSRKNEALTEASFTDALRQLLE